MHATDAPADATRCMPWLSVLVPAYNVAAYIGPMLDSVLSQSDSGVEVVVVDDASSDDTVARVERIAATDARVRLLRNPSNAGVAATRERLLDAATGDHVWFVDADDTMLPGAIPELRALLHEDAVDVVLCDFRTLDPLPWRRRRRSSFHGPEHGDDTAALLAGALEAAQFHVWSKIARRELWRPIRFPRHGCFEDMPAVAALLGSARRWRHVRASWIGYRQRRGSLSRDLPAAALVEHAQALRDTGWILAAHRPSPRVRQALDYFLLRGHASIARRLGRSHGTPADVAAACRGHFLAQFPDAGAVALAECRRRGWWLRAWRIASALDGAGWRRLSPR